ncbi:hypothetical protein ACFVYG_33420 [Streptomyces sp. NPDC058256]|uniref:hypothetical protein n=1 Tax=Streptomyces sp. NPDC058256 TaxID=3346408 RepID=UPI0036E9E31E
MPSIDWPWAIILCRFSDVPAVPQPREYYVDLYAQGGAGGLADYWRAVSSNIIDITGSKVFGWLDMNRPSSDVSKLVFPRDRGQLVQWGRDTAAANGVDLSPFRQVLVVHNFGVDHGAAGNGVVIVHSNPTLCEFGFICHEMGHGFGLPHSFAANPDREYGDGWDVMSFATTTYQFPITFRGTSGVATVGLNAHNLEALGAAPPGRTWRRSTPDFSVSLTLDPLNQPPLGHHGYLVARISRGGTTYTAEFRRKAGWDQGIPEDAVSVREIRTNGLSYLYPSAGARLTAGQQFVTSDPGIYIQATAITSTASLRIWDLPNGSLRKEDSKPKVYLVENGRKRWVTSPAVLFALGRTWGDVRSVPDGALASIPDGPNVNLISVTVAPYPVPLGRRVSVTVQATDTSSGTPIQGNVDVDGVVVGTTGTAFSRIFRTKRTRIPGTQPPEWDISYPQGIVHVPSYPDAEIDFGFTDL